MGEADKLLIKALELSNKIIKGDYKKHNWKLILDSIAQLCGVDGAFIGFWYGGSIKFKYSSFFMAKNYPKRIYPQLYEVPLESRKEFYKKLKKDGFLIINDYQNYPLALKSWLDIGLKSLLAVLIKSDEHIFGSLHLISLKKIKDFSEDEVKILKTIADTIASELQKEVYIKQIEIEKEKNKKQLELFKLIDSRTNQHFSVNLIAEALKKIKEIAHADMMCFLFASENLYITLNDKVEIGDIEASKKNMIYSIWKNNTKTVSQSCSTDKNYPKHCIYIPILSNNKIVGVFGFGFTEEPPHEFKEELETFQNALAHFISIIYTYKTIRSVFSELSDTEEGLIQAFVYSTEAKDIYTRGHSEHVATYSKLIARKLGLDMYQQEMMYNAGLLHDIGKIGIPDAILLKPSKLTPFEFEIMKYHPVISYEIVKNVPKFKGIAKCIRHHHEKMDGSGYPDGLKEPQIELGARILTIADIFDALTTDRPYRKALTPEKAIEILKKEKVDQNILSKVEDVLKKGFIKEAEYKSTFIPEKIEHLRKHIAELDYMTGLKRRSYLIRAMDNFIKENKPFILFMVDIKNTAYINHRYGRDVGDKIILFVADELKKILKKEALARTSADAFMFMYTGDDAESFQNIISNQLKNGILQKIKDKNCIIDENEAKNIIGCYITYSKFPQDGKTADELMYICSSKNAKKQ
ncbi:HD domain-containing phosphohydrolase [Hippea maritima]|uniref:Diguanylate cyclase and metal dependent phosphohydrolase n=1 Tax=Hippea maritima (strain ATCC 700847 / DSM 10411 / MH2) TaxID=760142 RepID=F2LWY3_HIPMA|nr:HD domain-containing phosphohydrolase [Hippea maritima]AEA34167.1 diguanylate cyclase and metal dependent phosphohydrolase [Hippea maritima DSM 10411]